MKLQSILPIFVISSLACATAYAWDVQGSLTCPNNGLGGEGVTINVTDTDNSFSGSTTTTSGGFYFLTLPETPACYKVCVDKSTLPAGAVLNGDGCSSFCTTPDNFVIEEDFSISANSAFCKGTPPSAGCWMTGGGQIAGLSSSPPDQYSFGGVVAPGCSLTPAGGGNLNLDDHINNLHFQAQTVQTVSCSGIPTSSPRVLVNVITFSGTGTLSGVAGNPFPSTPVCYTAHATDNHDSGKGSDLLGIKVFPCSSTNPIIDFSLTLDHGNIQIHTTSCSQ